MLRFIRMAGVTESTYLPPGHSFAGLFDDVKSNITAIFEICSKLRSDIADCQSAIQKICEKRGTLADCNEELCLGRERFRGVLESVCAEIG